MTAPGDLQAICVGGDSPQHHRFPQREAYPDPYEQDLKASTLQEKLEKLKYSREDIVEWISRFKYGDPDNKECQRQIIDIFLNSIYGFDDKLVFTYNYKNGTQTVTLADVYAAFGSDL